MHILVMVIAVVLGGLFASERPGLAANNCTQPIYDVTVYVPVQFSTPFGKEKALLMYDKAFAATFSYSTLNLGDRDEYLECIDVKDVNNDTKSIENMRICAIPLKINEYSSVLAAEAYVNFPYDNNLAKIDGCDVTTKVDFAKAYDLDKAPSCAAGDTACVSFATVRENVAKYVIADLDKDGVITAQDNCWSEVNKDQVDSDQDKIGDVCDPEKTKAFGGATAPGDGAGTGGGAGPGGGGTTTPATACKTGFLLYNGNCYKDANGDGIADTPLPDPSGVATTGPGNSGQTPATGGTGTGPITATTTAADTGGGCSLIVTSSSL